MVLFIMKLYIINIPDIKELVFKKNNTWRNSPWGADDLRDDDGSICFYGIHYQNFGFQKKITFAVAIFTNQPLSMRYCHESLPNALGFQLMWKTQQHRLAFWIPSMVSGQGLRFHSNKRGKKLKKQQNCRHKNCNISPSRMS